MKPHIEELRGFRLEIAPRPLLIAFLMIVVGLITFALSF
jgi:hypothetical protein